MEPIESPHSRPFWQTRPDGWPLCPACGEDELWSSFAWDGSDPKPPMQAWIDHGLRCHKCGFDSELRDPPIVGAIASVIAAAPGRRQGCSDPEPGDCDTGTEPLIDTIRHDHTARAIVAYLGAVDSARPAHEICAYMALMHTTPKPCTWAALLTLTKRGSIERLRRGWYRRRWEIVQ